MSLITASELITEFLKKEKISHIFTLTGGHITPILESCVDKGIKIIDTRHEQAAAIMAEGESMFTRKPGVCILTAGVGFTNALTGIADAHMAQTPTIFITGQSEISYQGMGALQEMEQASFVSPITKWSTLITDIKRLPYALNKAFREATAYPPGPVNISIPIDVLCMQIDRSEVEHYNDDQKVTRATSSRLYPDPDLIKKAVKMLQSAKKPVIIAGSGVWWADADNELKDFVELTGIPVFTKTMARGSIPDQHPLCFGFFAPSLNGAAAVAGQSDLVLVIGKRLNYKVNYGLPPHISSKAKMIQLDISFSEIGNSRPVDLGIPGDAKAALQSLIDEASKLDWPKTEWVNELANGENALNEKFDTEIAGDDSTIHALQLSREISKFVDEDTIVVFDGGDVSHWGEVAIQAKASGHWRNLGPLGALGTGFPRALTAKLLNPSKKVISIMGDGSFGLCAMEFDTAVRHNIPVVAVVGNNSAWGMIYHEQESIYGKGRTTGANLLTSRYDKVVEALGGHGEYVEKLEDFTPALKRALESGKPACINVVIKNVPSPSCYGWINLKRSFYE